MGKLIKSGDRFRRPPFFKFNAAEWLTDINVLMMTSEQRGWYLMMLANQWNSSGCHLVNSVDAILLYAGINPGNAGEVARFDTTGQIVLNRFEKSECGKYIFNQRLMDEFEELLAYRLEASKASKRRWNGSKSNVSKDVQPIGTHKQPIADPIATQCKTETETETKDIEVQKQSPAPTALAKKFELPGWVPAMEWAEYEEMRRKIRKPMTDAARTLAVHALSRLRVSGHPPEGVLQQSILNSWQGLFEIKGSNGGANGNRQDKPISSADRRAYSIAETTNRALIRVTGGIPGDDPPDVGIRADNLAQSPIILPPR